MVLDRWIHHGNLDEFTDPKTMGSLTKLINLPWLTELQQHKSTEDRAISLPLLSEIKCLGVP